MYLISFRDSFRRAVHLWVLHQALTGFKVRIASTLWMISDHLSKPLIFLAMYPFSQLKSSFLHPEDNNCFSNVSLPFTSETMQKSAILSNQSVIKLQLSFQRYGYDRFIGKRLYCWYQQICP